MRTTFLSKGGPRAQELIAHLAKLYPVYEAEPGVIDVYSDDQAALFSQLNSARPNWRTYLQVGEGDEGTASLSPCTRPGIPSRPS